MPTHNTPGVYVEEVSTLPPSVAEVATAIPAFIGTTQKGAAGKVEIVQCSTLLEYELRFGGAAPTAFTTDAAGKVTPAKAMPERLMWYALNLYFKNGGGRCYVVSVDNYDAPLAKARFSAGLAALEREDEPTLIVMPEIVALAQADFDDLCQQSLSHCKKQGDRFAILDVKVEADKPDVAASRAGYGSENLSYGAAYHPYLTTALTHVYDETKVTVGSTTTGGTTTTGSSTTTTGGTTTTGSTTTAGGSTTTGGTAKTGDTPKTLADLKSTETDLYNKIKKNLSEQRVDLPPSAAIAGIYARVDRERGVWKAPANVGVLSVLGPTVQITNDEQENLNVESKTGKSINAIRTFSGRGPLVWGARTLAGNDNEWRYVSVRRLFLMIEESVKAATSFAVFEANDVTTWLKVKGMVESYLYGLWEQGALQGEKPEAAYYVHVGLGRTMTPQDVLEGRMIVEIGLAAVRPAEFIMLRFSHKMAEA